eukprot:scaffold122434_cov63-Phaeocystis_antarctica.AAC.3
MLERAARGAARAAVARAGAARAADFSSDFSKRRSAVLALFLTQKETARPLALGPDLISPTRALVAGVV